jgi:DNA-binding NarL/FixJ family response regulator
VKLLKPTAKSACNRAVSASRKYIVNAPLANQTLYPSDTSEIFFAPDYARELLCAFPEEVRQAVGFDVGLSSIPQLLVEPLSERELEVRRLMATGLKYQEICGKLVVNVNTVRHHTRNNNGKIDVNSRALT